MGGNALSYEDDCGRGVIEDQEFYQDIVSNGISTYYFPNMIYNSIEITGSFARGNIIHHNYVSPKMYQENVFEIQLL